MRRCIERGSSYNAATHGAFLHIMKKCEEERVFLPNFFFAFNYKTNSKESGREIFPSALDILPQMCYAEIVAQCHSGFFICPFIFKRK